MGGGVSLPQATLDFGRGCSVRFLSTPGLRRPGVGESVSKAAIIHHQALLVGLTVSRPNPSRATLLLPPSLLPHYGCYSPLIPSK